MPFIKRTATPEELDEMPSSLRSEYEDGKTIATSGNENKHFWLNGESARPMWAALNKSFKHWEEYRKPQQPKSPSPYDDDRPDIEPPTAGNRVL